MKRTYFWALATFLAIPSALLSESADVPKPGAPAPLTVAPVVELDSASSMEVRIVLENTSKEPIKYLLANDSRIIAGLGWNLYREGKLIQPRVTDEPPVRSKERIREIKPGENVQPAWNLRNIYGELKPGRYEFRIRYRVLDGSVSHKEYGTTPMSFEQKLYLEIK